MDTEFKPLDDYGVIGNDERVALVGADGSIDWLCFPHLEDSSVFAAILDTEKGGRFAVEPQAEYDSSQAYVDRTNVLETTVETESGTATMTDLMPVRMADEPYPHERFQHAVYRKLEGASGSVSFDVCFEPRFDYARAETSLEIETGEEGDDEGKIVASGDGERLHLHHHGDLEFELESDDDGPRATGTVTLEEGDTCWLSVQHDHSVRLSPEECETVLEGTVDYWREWLDECEASAGSLFEFDEAYTDALIRSALVLKLLIHEETGSICAAPTTSIPEVVGEDLNWDYRYNWIRDAKFSIQALYNVGQEREARQYFEWFRNIGHTEPEEIQPLYGLHGETDIGEETLDHLSGYRDSEPVRIGNAAATQEQHDIYGTIVQGVYETVRYENGLTDEDWDSICALANRVCEIWDEPDAGIWEFRDDHRHYVHSKLLCWVALDRGIQLATDYDYEGPLERWEREREAIREDILEHGYDEDLESFVQHYDTDDALDATVLLIPIYDFLPADDHRVQGTIDTVLEEMTTDDGLVFRFVDSEARPDEPTAFGLCSFWLVDALVLSGRVDEAEEIFTNVLEYATPLGLLSEMIDPDTGELLGNFPQAFSHIGLLNSALYLASANEEVGDLPPEELGEGDGANAPLFRRHGSE
ncbi:glycoside hydrolase family 15 protein [Halobacteria archaeon AArc-m2/3/4]|uniref:Glycoside hydrolase family 15 protein n=1 Tax=Natronoglomus mannanivorans TaxID=2979990 RepID=A0ABT2QDS8_9EURY|nr:glycoside hydrolase family 15 protein [Halobacteria archaeon AArc-m2/3/4]